MLNHGFPSLFASQSGSSEQISLIGNGFTGCIGTASVGNVWLEAESNSSIVEFVNSQNAAIILVSYVRNWRISNLQLKGNASQDSACTTCNGIELCGMVGGNCETSKGSRITSAYSMPFSKILLSLLWGVP